MNEKKRKPETTLHIQRHHLSYTPLWTIISQVYSIFHNRGLLNLKDMETDGDREEGESWWKEGKMKTKSTTLNSTTVFLTSQPTHWSETNTSLVVTPASKVATKETGIARLQDRLKSVPSLLIDLQLNEFFLGSDVASSAVKFQLIKK